MADYKKIRLQLRAWLQGVAEISPEYYDCLRALDFSEELNDGLRKDGITPAFQHQIQIAQYLRTIHRGLTFPAQTLTAAILHDDIEDNFVDRLEIRAAFGTDVEEAVWRLTKKTPTMVKPLDVYFSEIAESAIASVVKGADRIHNVQSMIGVFSKEKQIAYAQEVRDLFLPMLKIARRRFPAQEPVYENIKLILESQLQFLAALNGTGSNVAVA